MQTIEIPYRSLVILCGPAGCGKSTFARKHFKETQIVSSDRCRAMISDDEENMAVSGKAFKLFHMLIDMRLSFNRLTVADSTALTRPARKRLKKLANKHNFYTTLVLFNFPLELCLKQNASRERTVDPAVILKHQRQLKKTINDIPNEGYHRSFIMETGEVPEALVNIIT
ncbi:AAA family ATPase [Desulfoscipio geothermicus]|uniref:Predicted kinase n=1 Tax=Desulfoscipio geothermicus DSM 3669 TaxID=1121426 RepID=A0A1I6DX86_9FIRM|nr:AAA family ATPase [Desulfoscipio geothermicus]SFR10120.1 Predicted kinase [Desulfoscipio geothermicus DSM 3669]